MKKYGFTLIELIFVIVLMGVLTGIGFSMAQPDATKQDAQYTLLKLKEARYRAIGYQSPNDFGVEGGCVILNDGNLSNNEVPKHEIKSDSIDKSNITTYQNNIPHQLNDDTLCFDSLGRPHDGNNTNLSSLLQTPLDINFSDNSTKYTTIRLFPQTGYAIITCKNP